jgi:MFS family permease
VLRFIESDLADVLRIPAFRGYCLSRIAASIAQTMLQAVIAWQVYQLSGSALQLGIIGLVRFVPAFALSFVSGAVVDTYNRQRVLLAAQMIPLLSSAIMVAALATGHDSLPLVYGIVFFAGVASAFEGPARQSLIPALVPRHLFQRAITLNSTLQSICSISGPAVGGILIAVSGLELAYAVHFTLILLSMVLLWPVQVPNVARASRPGVNLTSIREGLAYVRTHPIVLGAMTLDLFAVIFGGAKALLPIYAVEVLHADAIAYGILTAAIDVGALSAAILMIALPTPVHTGRVLLASVAAYGLATVAFGLATWLPASIVFYALVGAADQVSVVMRQNAIQLSIPDELRGRITAVNFVFINASNQLGALESGVVATMTNAMFAVVTGGIACVGVVGLIAWRIPELREYQAQPTYPDAAAATA